MANSEKEKASIEGILLMLDDRTPHVAVPVEAILDGEVVATTLSDDSGKYQLINLKPGQYQLRCQVLGGYVYYQATSDALRVTRYEEGNEDEGEFLHIKHRETLKNIAFRFAPFKKGSWKSYSYLDGLASDRVFAIYRDPDGVMWFGTRGGVSRYDGKEFANFTKKDGLVDNYVYAIHGDPDGVLWFGTWNGVSRYDGKEFVNFTARDGLAGNTVRAIYRDPDGVMWFGVEYGISRYDGKEFVSFDRKDGAPYRDVHAIHRDPDGVMWFVTWGGGLYRYDGKEFVNFTTEDGLAENRVLAIHRDPDGVMCFGTMNYGDLVAGEEGLPRYGRGGGLSRYDGKGFVSFTTKDGLAANAVRAIYRDPDGVMWIGTNGGVSRYDGKGFVNFTAKDGLVDNAIHTIYHDPDGVMWFGAGQWISGGGGLSR